MRLLRHVLPGVSPAVVDALVPFADGAGATGAAAVAEVSTGNAGEGAGFLDLLIHDIGASLVLRGGEAMGHVPGHTALQERTALLLAVADEEAAGGGEGGDGESKEEGGGGGGLWPRPRWSRWKVCTRGSRRATT